MSHAVTQRPRARLDLLEQFVYLGESASADVAHRYFRAVEGTCAQLLAHPLSGTRYDSGVKGLDGLRRVRVKAFESYWIFYVPVIEGIDIVRVLHASRDIETIFAGETAT
jgi:toxin ParE1/3/4